MKDVATSSINDASHFDRFNIKLYGASVHRIIFPVSIGMTLLMVLAALIIPEGMGQAADSAKNWILQNADWYIMIMGNLAVLFCFGLALSPLGKIRLGGQDAKPEYGTFSWGAMLFAAGMGIGMVFWSVSEPVAHYSDVWGMTPLNVAGHTPEALHLSMGATIFHWGFHPWAFYITGALVVGYFSYNKGLPMSYSSGIKPLIGKAHNGIAGQLLDSYTVVLTIFGLAQTLGFASLQATDGISRAFRVEDADPFIWPLCFIIATTAAAAFSLWRGMHRGVKLLSNINIVIALVLLAFVAVAIGLWTFISGVFSTSVDFARFFLPLANWIGREDSAWYQTWTVFYWAWWCTWGPLVGMFVARVSRGRSIRQIVFMVLVVPTIAAIFWFTGFGLGAIKQMIAGVGTLGSGGLEAATSGIFQFLEVLPGYRFVLPLVIALMVLFLVTSTDSAALVVDSLASGGKLNTPVGQRIIWLILIALVCTALFVVGGKDALSAIQTAIIVMAFPFMTITLLLMIAMLKELIVNRKQVYQVNHQ